METRRRELPIVINDISDDSIYLIYTPAYRELPFLPTGVGHFRANPGYYIERSEGILNMCLIMFCKKGTGSLSYRGRNFYLNPGQAVLINGMEYHKYSTAPGCMCWDFKWIRFSSPHFPLYDALIHQGDLSVPDISRTSLEEQHTAFLSCLRSDNKLKDVLLSDLIQNMLTTLCVVAANRSREVHLEREKSMEVCRKYILENYAFPVTLDELARLSCLTKYSFIRKFRQFMGISPCAYLRKIRINNALALLEVSDKSICEISGEVGFGDQNNFAKQFRLNTGMTPTQYRNQFRSRRGVSPETDNISAPNSNSF
ncbi:MAG: AraC family transcriptional regulator [Synergistaceae bacterium]|jgi:AraC-like DNA-binding protein|nr:AraC family transcriptional regulator [Synergistaceae bacterium]